MPEVMDEDVAREGRGMKWNVDEGQRSPGRPASVDGDGETEMERLLVETE